MTDIPLHKRLPDALVAELKVLFDEAEDPKHLKDSITKNQRADLEQRWPILLQQRAFGMWWKAQSVQISPGLAGR